MMRPTTHVSRRAFCFPEIGASVEPKYMLIVTEPAGWVILDTPRSQSQGAVRRRAEPVGKPLYAYDIIITGGVPYAYLVPQNPARPEWGRVSEAGGVIVNDEGGFEDQVDHVRAYVKVIPLAPSGENDLAAAIRELASAIRSQAK